MCSPDRRDSDRGRGRCFFSHRPARVGGSVARETSDTMYWLSEFIREGSAASGMAILALAVAIGLALGSIRIRGARLGISGVLFAALLFGQCGLTINETVLSF